jgi:hyperosmotically inducible protein
MKSKVRLQGPLIILVSLLMSVLPGMAKEKKGRISLLSHRDPAQVERWLKTEVRHELLMLPYYSVFDNLEYRVNGDNVELLGQVARPSLKSDAQAAIEKIEGIGAIINNVQVLPLSPNDDQIRRAVYRAIYGNSSMLQYAIQALPPIHIIVENGKVTLVGVVAKEMDKMIAYTQANSVPGVFSVTNKLQVESAKEGSNG